MCCTKHLMLRVIVPGVGSLWASREITRSALLLQLLITLFYSFLHLTSPVIITSPGLPSLTATMFQMFPMEEWFVSCEMTRVSSVLRCVSKIMHSIKSFPPDLHHTFVIDTGESSFFLFSKPFFVEEDFKNRTDPYSFEFLWFFKTFSQNFFFFFWSVLFQNWLEDHQVYPGLQPSRV